MWPLLERESGLKKSGSYNRVTNHLSPCQKQIWNALKKHFRKNHKLYKCKMQSHHIWKDDYVLFVVEGPSGPQPWQSFHPRKVLVELFSPDFLRIKFWRNSSIFGENNYEYANPESFDLEKISRDIITWIKG